MEIRSEQPTLNTTAARTMWPRHLMHSYRAGLIDFTVPEYINIGEVFMYMDSATAVAPSAAEPCYDPHLRLPVRYQTLSESGRGGMGIVLKAIDTETKRVVAVKVIRTEHRSAAEAAEYASRFRREWQVTASLSHPNIVTVFDASDNDGTPFFVMEYLEGKPLRDVMKERGPLTIEEAVRIFGQICEAMDYAHGRGVVHRDLKPSNLMLLSNGILKVTDFGVARTASSDLTRIGSVVGTPRYKSPEELIGIPADHRSDIFSLGIILQELLTGEHPFDAPTGSSVVRRILSSEPTWPSEANDVASPRIRAVVAKALAKSPENRYQSCRELINELSEATATSRSTSEPINQAVAAISRFVRTVALAAAGAVRLCQRIRSAIRSPKSTQLRATLVIAALVAVGFTSFAILARRPKELPQRTNSKQQPIYRVVGAVRFPAGQAQGITLDLRNLLTGEVRETQTNQDGSFQFNLTLAGPYELSVREQAGMGSEVAVPITFLGGPVEWRDFLLKPLILPARLSGHVRSYDHKPIQSFEVIAANQDMHNTVSVSGTNGSYAFSALDPGVYNVSVRDLAGHFPARQFRVSLSAGEFRRLDVVLIAGQNYHSMGEVCGMAHAESGASLPTAEVHLVDAASTILQTIQIHEQGPFCFEHVPEGVYSVRATPPAGWSVEQAPRVSVDGGRVAKADLLFRQRHDVTPLPPVSFLRGAVETVGKRAMPSVHVQISRVNSPGLLAIAVTDSTGVFEIKLPLDEYKISVPSTPLFAGGSTDCASAPRSVVAHCTLILNPALIFRAKYRHLFGSSTGYLIVTESDIVYKEAPPEHHLNFVAAKIRDAHTLNNSDFEFSYNRKRYRFSIVQDSATERDQPSVRLDSRTAKRAITDFDSVLQTALRTEMNK